MLSPPVTNTLLFFQIEGRDYSEELLTLSRSYASAFWLSPRAAVWGDTVLISTPTKNYTAGDYEQLFNDAGYLQGYTQLSDFDVDWTPPNVPTYCFYGLGFPTPLTYVYDADLPDAQPTAIIYGEGDGVVNEQSLEVCQQWANSSYPFNRTVFYGRTHFDISSDKSLLESLGKIVGAPSDPIDGRVPVCLNKNTLALDFVFATMLHP